MQRLRRLAQRVERFSDVRFPWQVSDLFEASGYRTRAAGYSHARFSQYTDLAHAMNLKMLKTLTETGIEHLVFAGFLVGYVRDGSIPLWTDDVDVMIFEKDFERFETETIPRLREAGFLVFRQPVQREKPFGGYSIVGLGAPDWKMYELPALEGHSWRIPSAQVDVFFSRIDEHDCVRNVGRWGRYHLSDVPKHVVLPPSEVLISGSVFQTYCDPREGVRLEYGEVRRRIWVFSHHKDFGEVYFRTPTWKLFRNQLERVIQRTTHPGLPGGGDQPVGVDASRPHYRAEVDEPLDSIVQALSSQRFSGIRLVGPAILWATDLQDWFSGLAVTHQAETDADRLVARQLLGSIDRFRLEDG